METFDEETKKWGNCKAMNIARCASSVVRLPLECSFIVCGGYNGRPLNLVEKFSPEDNEWTTLTNMNHHRYMHAALISQD